MVLFEKICKEYVNYLGVGEKPENFDEFWDRELLKITEQSLNYQMIRKNDLKSSIADFYDLWFEGIENGRIHCQLALPKKIDGKISMMLNFHGYHTNSGDWVDKIGLVAEGFAVLAMDARGQGGLSDDQSPISGGILQGLIIRGVEQGPEHLYFKRVFLDCAQMAKIAFTLPFVDGDRVYCQGASQGGALALVAASLEPRISKAIVQYPFLSDYEAQFSADIDNSAYAELAYYFKFRDPQHLTDNKFFRTLSYIDLKYLVSRIRATVVWGIGLRDTICPPFSQFAVFNHLMTKKVMIPLEEYGHEYLPTFGDTVHNFILFDDEKILNNKGVKL